jgi:hypothetical protein
MRLGLIARATNRGLGIQTWEIWRHLNPAVTVLIDSIPDRGRWKFYPERFTDAVITEWEGYTAPISAEAEDALLTCDVIFTVETPYSVTLFEKARAKGIATVIYVNPELWREHETEHASAVWVPTAWRNELIPRAEIVPMPVALDRFQFNPGNKYLHLGGHKARLDRNGMELSIRAARYAQIPLTVTTQDRLRMDGRGIQLMMEKENYWEMYEGHGVLVMPRKYGGLCLPVQEAMAAGLAVIMSDTAPNADWPVALVKARRTQRSTMVGGVIDIYETDKLALAEEMTRMLDLDYRREFQERGRAWAEAHSWGELKAEWLARLAELC